jgi:proteasome lid subunit RPN8/RPN11
LLGGLGQEVRLVIPVPNVDSEAPGARFIMDPGAQIEAWRWIQAMGYDVIGVYHSHPVTCETKPSRYDLTVIPPHLLSVIVGIKPMDREPTPESEQFTPPARLVWHPTYDIRYRTWLGDVPQDIDPFVMGRNHAQ